MLPGGREGRRRGQREHHFPCTSATTPFLPTVSTVVRGGWRLKFPTSRLVQRFQRPTSQPMERRAPVLPSREEGGRMPARARANTRRSTLARQVATQRAENKRRAEAPRGGIEVIRAGQGARHCASLPTRCNCCHLHAGSCGNDVRASHGPTFLSCCPCAIHRSMPGHPAQHLGNASIASTFGRHRLWECHSQYAEARSMLAARTASEDPCCNPISSPSRNDPCLLLPDEALFNMREAHAAQLEELQFHLPRLQMSLCELLRR